MRAGLEGYGVCEVLFLHEFGGVAGAVADDLHGVDACCEAADVHAEVVGVGHFYAGYEFAFSVVDAYAGIAVDGDALELNDVDSWVWSEGEVAVGNDVEAYELAGDVDGVDVVFAVEADAAVFHNSTYRIGDVAVVEGDAEVFVEWTFTSC